MVVRDAAPPPLIHPHEPTPPVPTITPSPVTNPEPLGVEADGLHRTVRAGRGRHRREVTLLRDVSFAIEPGELVAIVGGSGAGKTTLLTTLAGVQRPSSGRLLYNGEDFAADSTRFRDRLGYVPQDDIVHKELTVARTLDYAARLRLPADTTPEQRNAVVSDTLAALGLTEQAHQRVGSLSGGQRKRTSIGAELLTHPSVFFLDEPTSGLDPATGRDMMHLLHRLADDGSTVVLTTHAPQDVELCDRVIVLAQGGFLVFSGTPEDALAFFDVASFPEVYDQLVADGAPERWAAHFRDVVVPVSETPAPAMARSPSRPEETPRERRAIGPLRQWAVLTERSFETLVRNPLTLAILAGSPVMVIAMFALLFRPGAFDPATPSPSAAIMVLFWVAFGAFFFGLTYGLLMICTEFPIFHRERLVNLRIAPYVLSKLTVLLPMIALVVALMLGVLRLTHRLPADGWDLYGPLAAVMLMDGICAVGLGLLASAAVTRPEQATLALPMLCFPQVLFSGAILPVPIMASAGKVMSVVATDKYAFNAAGKTLALNDLFADGTSPLGPPLLAQYGDTFSGSLAPDLAILTAFTVAFLALTCWVLARKAPRIA